MQRMPDIKLTTDEYHAIVKNMAATQGGESIICESGTPNTLYKLFIDGRGELCPMSDNKHKKIVRLYQSPLQHSTQPLSTISCEGELIGYEMTCDKEDRSLQSLPYLPRKALIDILRSTRDILLYYEANDITYGDIKDDNILINRRTGKVKFCDIDNIRLGEYPVDLKGYDLMRFYEKYGKIDGVADAYMHNLLTMQKLHFSNPGTYYSDIIKALRRGIYPTRFKQAARPIFESMTTPETFNGEYAIQYIKR